MLQAAGKLFRGGLILLAASAAGLAQQYSISTVAGAASPATVASAASSSIGLPARVTADKSGNFYFSSLNSVFKVSAAGVMTRVAGTTHAGFSGDGGPAVNAQLNAPQGLALDSKGNLYIADSMNNRVRMVSPAGIITTFAGNGLPGTTSGSPLGPAGPQLGDGGPATQANLHLPSGVAVDTLGDSFAAQGACPTGGCVYIADTSNNSIRMVGTDGIMRTVAGDTYTYGYGGDAGYPDPVPTPPIPPSPAAFAEFKAPEDVAWDTAGNILIADTGNSLIRRITTDGNINYIAGNPSLSSYFGDGASALLAGLNQPFSVAVDTTGNAATQGNVYWVEAVGSRLRKLDSTGNVNSICGNRGDGPFAGDSGQAAAAVLNMPTGVAVDSSGNIYIADTQDGRIRELFAGKGTINTVAGNGVYSFAGDGGPASQALMNLPQGVAVDAAGNIYISDTGNNVVREATVGGAISAIAGATAQLNAPEGVAVDRSGNVYVADSANHRVIVVSNGAVSTFAGTGTAGSAGDGGAARSAQLNIPYGVAIDGSGNLFIAEFGGNRVRKVSAANGTISTLAGTGVSGYSGDGLQAVKAQLSGPKAVAADAAGNVYVADTNNYVVRMVTAAGVISTVAGNGTAGYSGDLGPATAAQVANPSGVAVDSAGSLYITDGSTHVRKVYAGGTIITIAGNGSLGFSGDGGPATSAQLNGPTGIAVGASGVLYVADSGNNAIRLLTPGGGIGAVTNGASSLPGSIAPGEIVVIYGSGLGPAQLATEQLDASGLVATSLAGTSVLFNGTPGPVIYTWNTQVAAVVPYSVTGTAAQVIVLYQGQPSVSGPVALAPAAPGLFTLNYSGTGQAAAINQDGTLNAAGNPAQIGSSIRLYETGEGQTNPAGTDGSLGSATPPKPVVPVTATIGGQPATVLSYGGVTGTVAGVMQITVQVPAGVTPGNVPVLVQVGAASTQSGVTIAVRN